MPECGGEYRLNPKPFVLSGAKRSRRAYCSKMCLSCADACQAERQDMTQCIRMCLDCSDICEATARLGLRRTGNDQPMLRELLELCARMCEQCAAECERHDHEHCKLCAQICRECAADCGNAAASLA